MNPSRICFFAIFSKDFRKLRSSDVLAILLIAYGHILPKLFEFFKLNIEIAQNIFCLFEILVENMGVLVENLLKIWVVSYFLRYLGIEERFVLQVVLFRCLCVSFGWECRIKHSHPKLTAREWNGSAGFSIYKVL